jgi:hypothetical protein
MSFNASPFSTGVSTIASL